MTLEDPTMIAAMRRLAELPYGAAPADTVRIATGAATLRHIMSEAVVEFRYRHRRVRLEFLTASSSASCFDALLKDGFDLAWVTMSDPVPGIEQRPVVDLPWTLAMRNGQTYADRAWVEIAELSGLRLIRPPEGSASGRRLAAALADLSLAPEADTADWETATLLAELGVGHAIVPAFPGSPPRGGEMLRTAELRGLEPLPMGWAVRSWDALSPSARTFAEAVTWNCRAWRR